MGGQAKQVRVLVLLAGVAASLFVWTSLADPVQLPKLFLSGLVAACVLGIVIVGTVSGREKKFSSGQWAVLAFIAGLFIAGLFTDVKYRALFGTVGRNNGGLTYVVLAALCLGSMMSFKLQTVLQLRLAMISVGVVMTVHGLLENAGHELFNWENLYSPIVGTLGNPDFFSGLMGTCAVATLWFVFVNRKNTLRILGVFTVLVQLYLIFKTHSIQGLVAFAFGFSLTVITRLWQWRKVLGISALVGVCLAGPIAFLGILNRGPLASLLAKSSLNNRFDYWRAAWGMFRSHPITGVGLDRFGEYYGQYAPQFQVAQGQASDNAHNVLMQLLATGGLVVFIPYVFLLGLIGWTGFRGILKAKGQEQMNLVGLFSVWFALLVVSLVSIDNLGGTVWFWISGGALYAIAKPASGDLEPKEKEKEHKRHKAHGSTPNQEVNFLAPLVSLTLAVVFIVLAIPAIKSSAALNQLNGNKQQLDASHYVAKLKEAALIQSSNIDVLGRISSLAAGVPDPDLAIEFAKSLNSRDHRSFYGNMVSAMAYESKKSIAEAIPFRKRLMEIDRWNTANMIELERDYLGLSDIQNAKLISEKIASLYPDSDAAKAAEALLNG